nr:hypothetical protein [Metamycoplasma orale]
MDVNQREYEISKKYGAVFIYKIGYNLTNNKPHSSRAKDYDDWNLMAILLFTINYMIGQLN